MSTLAPTRPGSPYTGVRELIWLVFASNAVKLAYPDEPQRLARVDLMKTPAGSSWARTYSGVNETDLGAMMANELMLTLIGATSILSILTVIRHTRAQEEGGAAEFHALLRDGSLCPQHRRSHPGGGVNALLAARDPAAW